jgi:hypothetical protein
MLVHRETAAHTRSELVVGASVSYSSAWHTVASVHTRSLVAVGGKLSKTVRFWSSVAHGGDSAAQTVSVATVHAACWN